MNPIHAALHAVLYNFVGKQLSFIFKRVVLLVNMNIYRLVELACEGKNNVQVLFWVRPVSGGKASAVVGKLARLFVVLVRMFVENSLQGLHTDLEGDEIFIFLFYLERSVDRQEPDGTACINHGAAVGRSLVDQDFDTTADALNQVVVRIIFLQVFI